ncbi:hypothetical protein N7532_009675 [Penicillium argentinense]|uniref:F-box domain-containing protein n=1 Tax=Penicillium argentinense TaxID=1131581 RepID=A0A9W9K370_9EURO|nr:uncharacterized protein N7532_009675 [Penicillium argentinense]KAJ5090991.1 hypothetical protein N7532_009675 [Penicillium argentinense]
MSLLDLPPELLGMVACHLHSLATISALMKTSRWLHQFLQQGGFLYDRVPANRRDTVLRIACAEGTKKLAHAMLSRGANPTAEARHGQNPEEPRSSIEYAADRGHADIIEMILDHDTQIFLADAPSYTLKRAFDRAIVKGQAQVVRVILDQSKKATSETARGQKSAQFTSQLLDHGLNFAFRDAQEEVVEALLADDRVRLIEWNLPAAATGGNERLVRRCLAGLPHNMANYAASMEKAASCGNAGALKAILEVEGVDPNTTVGYSQPPLLVAVKNGHENIVQTLLERSDVQPELKDSLGWTPFAIAARKGYRGIMEILWKSGRVDIGWTSIIGQTPLSLAAEAGHGDVVDFLLSLKGVDVDSPNPQGRTPLSLAAGAGAARVVKTLLETGRVDPNSRDCDGQTPLAWAVMQGFPMRTSGHGQRNAQLAREEKQILALLKDPSGAELEPPTNSHSKDPDNRRREEATERGMAVLNHLLAREEVFPDSRDNQGHTPLSYAVRYRHVEAARLLLATGKVNLHNKDSSGRTPSDWITKR